MTSTGNRTRVARMVAKWFTHYATAAYQSFRLDINIKSGGHLVYVKSSVPSQKLKCDVLLKSLEAIPFELNLRKEKWPVISIYRPPAQDSEFFLKFVNYYCRSFHKSL